MIIKKMQNKFICFVQWNRSVLCSWNPLPFAHVFLPHLLVVSFRGEQRACRNKWNSDADVDVAPYLQATHNKIHSSTCTEDDSGVLVFGYSKMRTVEKMEMQRNRVYVCLKCKSISSFDKSRMLNAIIVLVLHFLYFKQGFLTFWAIYDCFI